MGPVYFRARGEATAGWVWEVGQLIGSPHVREIAMGKIRDRVSMARVCRQRHEGRGGHGDGSSFEAAIGRCDAPIGVGHHPREHEARFSEVMAPSEDGRGRARAWRGHGCGGAERAWVVRCSSAEVMRQLAGITRRGVLKLPYQIGVLLKTEFFVFVSRSRPWARLKD